MASINSDTQVCGSEVKNELPILRQAPQSAGPTRDHLLLMAAKGTSKAEKEMRIKKFAQIIATGGRRSDCCRYAAEKWGVDSRTVDRYLAAARDQIRADWDLERPQMIADLLSQCSTLQLEARKAKQYHIALGAINTAAKLAQLCS